MIKVSKKVEYGLTSLIHLDSMGPHAKVTTKELSEIYEIPEQHLGKVLQKMAKADLVDSTKGAHGGYSTRKSLSDISLGQLVEVLDGPAKAVHEGEQHALCVEFCTCYAKGVMHEIQQYVRRSLYDISLARLLNREKVEPAQELEQA
ncbi:MAG: Rrf2 family protein [Candidatus Omnitrophota bacterium]|jgi:Rrf2 family protein